MLAAAEAAEQIENECTKVCPNDGTCESKCDGCITGLSYLFVKYGDYLD
jgi:hypothetical protein